MKVDVATFKVRPYFEPDGPVAWIAVAHHESDGETWATIGAAEKEAAAFFDLTDQLPPEAVPTFVQNEVGTEELCAKLLWSAKSRAMQQGTPIVQVP